VATAPAAGALLGRFHAALVDLDPSSVIETLPGFHDPRRRLDALRAAIAADPCARAASAQDEIELVARAEPLVARAGDLVARVPTRVAHNDAKLDNFLFRGAEAVGLVDLDTLMPGAWFWDVGDLLRSASTRSREDDPRAAIDPQLYRATLDAYRGAAGRVLTEDELDAVESAGAIVTFEQAVRFLTDWIEGDVYYRTTRPGQNLDRSRAQLRLLESMPGTVPYS
jgi:Ser/Thr protein kinase RdoA (MazF antagonist)